MTFAHILVGGSALYACLMIGLILWLFPRYHGRLRQVCCRHQDELPVWKPHAMYLECPTCGRRTPGWEV